MPARSGPPTVSGRWSLLPERETDPTLRAHALADGLLDRHGVVTRGAVMAERVPGGFAAAYRVLAAFEEVGRARRGYAVEGLGAAQFFSPGAVDRLRTYAAERREPAPAIVLAATDPANAYGAALAWPARPGEVASGHKPGRKAGALVVLHDGELVLYVERGGRSLLTWTEEPATLQPAVDALALAVRDGQLGKLAVERADGVVGPRLPARPGARAGRLPPHAARPAPARLVRTATTCAHRPRAPRRARTTRARHRPDPDRRLARGVPGARGRGGAGRPGRGGRHRPVPRASQGPGAAHPLLGIGGPRR